MNKPQTPAFTFIDLFAGIGGFRLALSRLGGQCLAFSEIDNSAIATYCTNFQEKFHLNLGNITKITVLPKHDILTAGVPCQSWSIAGKNLGFDDDRGQLWNDTLCLLHHSRPKAFIFENVKGLADPRNANALAYILSRIKEAGYFAHALVINSADYGVPQDRIRVYLVGFAQEKYLHLFKLPTPHRTKLKLVDVLEDDVDKSFLEKRIDEPITDLFGMEIISAPNLKQKKIQNDFFLFNDIRNGATTLHSWDLLATTEREKEICLLLLRNRRKRIYGKLDGNPLSLTHLQQLDSSIRQEELEELRAKGILKHVPYAYTVIWDNVSELTIQEELLLRHATTGQITLDSLKECRELKKTKTNLNEIINSLVAKSVLRCSEMRYEFRYTKISTGIEGINRIFLPRSHTFPTLVASDTNDFIALRDVKAENEAAYKHAFLHEIFYPKYFRKITQVEACRIQGFPDNFQLPESRNRWMKLIGNSVAVPVVEVLARAILATGCLHTDEKTKVAA